jgi:hypothetical protein
LSLSLLACGGHTERTLKMRTALDVGSPKRAVAELNEELDVKSEKDLPKDLVGDNALLVLDRASIQQSTANFADSKHDFEAADKVIDMLDLAHNAGDSIGKYIFSDSVGRYQAPPYEKLLINTLNMLNYLELHDLNGALVEARRLSVTQKYFRDQLKEHDNAVLGVGSFLAGFAFEKNGETDEALRYYDEALQFSGYGSLRDPVRRLLPRGSYRSPRLMNAAGLSGLEADAPPAPAPSPATTTATSPATANPTLTGGANSPPPASLPGAQTEDDLGEIVFVVGFGRVPHKIANRIPIGLALTLFATQISPANRRAAGEIAAQGLVTWINFPSLGKDQGSYAIPSCVLDGRYVQLEEAVNVSEQVRGEWKKIEGEIIVSAITRLIARYAVGQGVRAAAGRDNVVGLLASLGTQATLTALDTPDTRSWETLPARIAIARVKVAPGVHSLAIDARGYYRRQNVEVPKGGWAVVSLMALR